ncbi:MAG TPA: Fe-S cluster assembly protein SufD [Dehalococcoidia bacterium]|nr:Fe-S cluster assembly protein SufD [Dehalococcoidia bacterium]
MTQETPVLAPGFTEITRASAEATSARHDEPAWLRERRAAAWAAYEAMDFPEPTDEEWRRTDVRSIVMNGVKPYAAAAPVADASQLPAPVREAWEAGDFAARLVQQDSEVVHIDLPAALRAQGVVLMDLHAAAREHEGLLRKRLGAAVRDGEWKYVALNAALWSGGALLYVPKDVRIDLPVVLTTAVTAEGLAMFPRVLVVAEAGASVRVIDERTSPDGAQKAFVSAATEIFAEAGAQVEYYAINRWGRGAYNFDTVRAVLGQDARFRAMAVGLGSSLTKMRIDTEMPQPGASAELLGITFGDGDQHFDYNTLQDHVGHHTVSDLQFKSAMTGSSSIVWYGITRINPGASASEANQTSRNLLLSEHAKAAPIPILEIEAWDVQKCSHGATAGPVDENELFYLEARAIPRATAERMLVEGFFRDVVDRVPDARLRTRIMDTVLAKAGAKAEALTFDEMMAAE